MSCTYTRFEAKQLRKAGYTIPGCDVVYDEELAGPDGMHFTLIKEPGITQAQIETAKHYLRSQRDVVGRIDIATIKDD